ncbi:MAG TPA: amidohydrolase family protein [Bacteroidales bacterium]|nr:amidohydrolase family protein [Bacteroidales bacterium]
MKISLSFVTWLSLVALISFSCHRFDSNSLYVKIRNHADEIKVINTHEHQHLPSEYGYPEFRFRNFLMTTYLAADVVSAGARVNPDSVKSGKLWDTFGKPLDYTRATSYYSLLVEGFRLLYGFNEPYFTKENLQGLSARLEQNYKNYPEWFDKSFRKAGFEKMILDQYWKPLNTEIDTAHFELAFNINFLISGAGRRPFKKPGSSERVILSDKSFGFDEYLAICDDLFRKNIEKKAVCIKNSQAYSRTLYYEDVPYEEASSLFQKENLTAGEEKKIEDFMFHYIIKKAIAYDLPVQIHTGYLAGSGGVLENGEPVKLNNLFLEYPQARFILFHGGFPWTGECAALAKMFPNVYLDLVWLPQISRQEAINSLDVMLDCVPYNKFCWGGDCQLIEESAGALLFAKDVVSEVLTMRVKRGLMTEDLALEITGRIFRENAIEIFRLQPE